MSAEHTLTSIGGNQRGDGTATVHEAIAAAGEPGGTIHQFARQLVDERGFAGVDVTIADPHSSN
jgi:hypothetical protein